MKPNKTQFQTCPVKQFDTRTQKQNNSGANLNPRLRSNIKRARNRSEYSTLQPEAIIEKHLNFKPEAIKVCREVPGVGTYDIGSQIVKPTFETYQKGNHVILVKINHVGGTSSFSNQGERFIEGQSIYQESLTPGPGAYRTVDTTQEVKRKNSRGHSDNYRIINQMITQSRDRSESIPNYSPSSKNTESKYNGMPRHLQEMYHRIVKEKEIVQKQRPHSLPLEHFLLHKHSEHLPIASTRYRESDAEGVKTRQEGDFCGKEREEVSPASRLTETMYRLDEQRRRQADRNKKIRAILDDRKRRSFSIEQRGIKEERSKQYARHIYNKNMVNMLYDVKYNQKAKHF